MATDWTLADRISDSIVDIFNDELTRMRLDNTVDAAQLLAGWLLAFKALQRTMPPARPMTLKMVTLAVDACLHEILQM